MREGTVVLFIKCQLDDGYFGPWEKLTPEQQAIFDGACTRCDGGGGMGSWCDGCHFCESFEEEAE